MKYKKDSLGDRMKKYEAVSKTKLIQRMPVIIRIDGKGFHTFTKGFNKPDKLFMASMIMTAKKLCENIQNCVFGYTQSDEITLVLVDYNELNITPWFDNEVQKLCSVTASMATMYFNRCFNDLYEKYLNNYMDAWHHTKEEEKLNQAYSKAYEMGAMFDARCFNVPVDDVTNNILWRQQDATRNSIQMAGQLHFTHKELQGKSCDDIINMLLKKGINYYSNFSISARRGIAILKDNTGKWQIDYNMPIITENRDYIENLIKFD